MSLLPPRPWPATEGRVRRAAGARRMEACILWFVFCGLCSRVAWPEFVWRRRICFTDVFVGKAFDAFMYPAQGVSKNKPSDINYQRPPIKTP
jgi:hypothetical protein